MESNVQPTGLPYLWSYSGGLNILEELLNFTIIILLVVSGFNTVATFFTIITSLSAGYTLVLIILHLTGTTRTSKLPWHWIECLSMLIIAILFAIFSTMVMSVWTKSYIITGIMGYCTSMVYFVDTFDKYRLAIKPVPRYAWTTPNMPDLS